MSQATIVPATEEIGYSYNNGGLTNQKWALLGLLKHAWQANEPVSLPMMLIKDHVTKKDRTVPFAEVFDLPSMLEFGRKYGVAISTADCSHLPMGGWNFFGAGAGCQNHLAINQDMHNVLSEFIVDFHDSLVPLVSSSYIMTKLKQDIFEFHGIDTVAQLRIESDWKFHSAVTLEPTLKEPEDYLLPYDRIVAKIVKTLPNTKRMLVVTDEAAMETTKGEIADVCRSKFGIQLFWKSDFLTPFETNRLNNLELSLIDFELATRGTYFIGLTRSTFSNTVTFQKYIRTSRLVTTDYIYNNNSLRLSRRTDNGGYDNPKFASK